MGLVGKTVQRIDAKGNVVYSLRIFEVVDECHGSVKLRDTAFGIRCHCIAGWFSATRVRVVGHVTGHFPAGRTRIIVEINKKEE